MTQLDPETPSVAWARPAVPLGVPGPALTWSQGRLFRNGRDHQILSGSMHYFRVHPHYWRDRLRRLVDMGLNTLDTYVPWNFHQPHRHQPPGWDDWRNLERYLGLASDEGLDVIVRPGPFICAEWSNGGLPSWLTGQPGVLRSSDPRFTTPVARWFDDLIPRIAAMQHRHGGPVVAVQVENEYGSYAAEPAYLRWLRKALIDRGISELLFTADGPTDLMLDAGTLEETVAAFTLGSKPSAARHLQRSRRGGEPFFVAEFWNGWFDHWGEHHHVRGTQSAVTTLRQIIQDGGSVSIYMAHGGTNFGLWAGANEHAGHVQPTITSYDSDAPIAEDGSLTSKFHAYREVLGASAPLRVSETPMFLPPTALDLTVTEPLLPALQSRTSTVKRSLDPETFDDHGLENGIMVQSATVTIPPGQHSLVFTDLRDRVTAFLDDHLVGSLEGPTGEITVTGTGQPVRLHLIVESSGRINYGPRLGQDKGICGPVLINRRIIRGWTNAPVSLQEWNHHDLDARPRASPRSRATPRGAGLAKASFDVVTPLDTHIRFSQRGRGIAWVNGFLLGRYWSIGPQLTLYCPAPLLRVGVNTITVLEMEETGSRIHLTSSPELGPTKEYIETF